MKSAFSGLMDTADPATQTKLKEILDRETRRHGLSYHQLRHRNLGDANWVEVHLLFPDDVSLTSAHRTATAIEEVIERSLEPRAHVTTHLESAADHAALHPQEDGQEAIANSQ
jgi:divalent metal cation (Fe/Co/Zn/Cd) transporter